MVYEYCIRNSFVQTKAHCGLCTLQSAFVVLRNDANDKTETLQNLFNEIYIQDITKRNRVKNIGELEDLLNILSSAIVSLTNPEKLKNTFKTVKKSKITSNTIKNIQIILKILS